jgi:hypothetical protein
MKLFTIIKTGYSSGIYGCSNEYFTAIVIKDDITSSYMFRGLYGEDERMKSLLVEQGFKPFYSYGAYGKIPSREYKASMFDSIKEIANKVKKI